MDSGGHRLQGHRLTFASHEGAWKGRRQFGLDGGQSRVIMPFVMVERGQRPRAGGPAQRDAGLPSRMSPSVASPEFGLGEHRVIDDEVGCLAERHDIGVGAFIRMFDVGNEAQSAAAVIEPIAGRSARMTQRACGDLDAVFEMQRFTGPEADVLDRSGQVVQCHGEERWSKQRFERPFGALPSEVAAEGPQLRFAHQDR